MTPRLEAIMRRLPTRTGGAMNSRRLFFLALALLVMIIFANCSHAQPPAPTETVRELSWSQIALPESVAASSLSSMADDLLVGGRASAGGDHPVLLVVDPAGSAHGAAHANFRWTVWAGSPERLDDYPQTFETFGGQSAGGLLDVVYTSDGPAIAGTWAAPGGGLDAAVWLSRGERWVRQ